VAKTKVVISGLIYIVTMMRYFVEAFEQRNDVDLTVVGPYFGVDIPWQNWMRLPEKYLKVPDIPLPRTAASTSMHPQMLVDKLPKDIDLFIQVDAGWRLSARPPGKVVAHVQTDPHVLKGAYALPKSYSDFNFCMQTPYIEPGEIFLPYALAPWHSYSLDLPKEYDVCMIGLQYPQRIALEKKLNNKGYTVKSGIGIIFDEYREAYNKSKVAVSWSSLLDTPNRCFEAFGMKVPLVCNRTPDIMTLFKEGEHFLGFDGLDEAVMQIEWLINHPEEAKQMTEAAYKAVMNGHTWDDRIHFILDTCGFI